MATRKKSDFDVWPPPWMSGREPYVGCLYYENYSTWVVPLTKKDIRDIRELSRVGMALPLGYSVALPRDLYGYEVSPRSGGSTQLLLRSAYQEGQVGIVEDVGPYVIRDVALYEDWSPFQDAVPGILRDIRRLHGRDPLKLSGHEMSVVADSVELKIGEPEHRRWIYRSKHRSRAQVPWFFDTPLEHQFNTLRIAHAVRLTQHDRVQRDLSAYNPHAPWVLAPDALPRVPGFETGDPVVSAHVATSARTQGAV